MRGTKCAKIKQHLKLARTQQPKYLLASDTRTIQSWTIEPEYSSRMRDVNPGSFYIMSPVLERESEGGRERRRERARKCAPATRLRANSDAPAAVLPALRAHGKSAFRACDAAA